MLSFVCVSIFANADDVSNACVSVAEASVSTSEDVCNRRVLNRISYSRCCGSYRRNTNIYGEKGCVYYARGKTTYARGKFNMAGIFPSCGDVAERLCGHSVVC